MFKETKVEVVPVEKSTVQWFRSLECLPGERDQESVGGQKRIVWLKKLYDDGEFYSPVWVVAVLDSKKYRINGGHSSNMLASVGARFPCDLSVIIRWFDCESQRDMLNLFGHFDQKRSCRTLANKADIHKQEYLGMRDVAASFIQKMISGILLYMNDGKVVKYTDEERLLMLHEDPEFLCWAIRYVKTTRIRSGAIACMYRSFCANRDQADEFWGLVLSEAAPRHDCPTRELARYFRTLEYKNATIRDMQKNPSWSPRAVYVKSIHAWNAWQRGESTKLKYRPATKTPILLYRTSNGLFVGG